MSKYEVFCQETASLVKRRVMEAHAVQTTACGVLEFHDSLGTLIAAFSAGKWIAIGRLEDDREGENDD